MIAFPSVYQRSVRFALFSQVITGLIAILMVLDTGQFAVRFLGLSLAFWICAGIFMFKRQRPSIIERLFVASGPILIFGIMIFVG